MRISIIDEEGVRFVEKNAWLIDIKLDNPYFDEGYGKELQYLQIS